MRTSLITLSLALFTAGFAQAQEDVQFSLLHSNCTQKAVTTTLEDLSNRKTQDEFNRCMAESGYTLVPEKIDPITQKNCSAGAHSKECYTEN